MVRLRMLVIMENYGNGINLSIFQVYARIGNYSVKVGDDIDGEYSYY